MKHVSQKFAQIRYGLLLVLALFVIQYLLFWGALALHRFLLDGQSALVRTLVHGGVLGCQLKLLTVLQRRLEARYPRCSYWAAVTWGVFILAGAAVIGSVVLLP